MQFISAEEFLKQSDEVQNVFNEWWKPKENDLYFNKVNNTVVECFNGENDGLYISHRNTVSYREDTSPIFVEGQLRQFIEEKTKDKYDILYYLKTKENVGFYKYNENKTQPTYEIETHDLLQAYWKVAVEIASYIN